MNMIIPGRASQALAIALARTTGQSLCGVSVDRFPDDELIVELDSRIDGRAIILGSIVSDAAFLELLLLQDAAREAGADELLTIIPYLGYARQDKSFNPGQPISIRAIARAISSGTDRVITVDPHEASVLQHFSVPTRAVSAAAQLAEPLPTDLIDPLFLAPDESATVLAETVCTAHGEGAIDYFEKVRRGGDEVEITPSDADVADRDVVLVDDIISTGNTMTESIEVLQSRGAARIFATCVHPLLTATARTHLARAGVTSVFGTDTIERPESVITVAPTLAPAVEP